MKVSVVIINWNGGEKLKTYLPEVLKLKQVDEFIVTDDASTDNSLDFLEKNYPQVKLVKRNKNGGFSSNANSGVKGSNGDLVFLLNPDAVPNRDCIINALPYFKDEAVFSVGCNTGGCWSWANWQDGFFWHYMSPGKIQSHQTLWSRGGSGIFRKKTWEKFGGMDELYNPFYEEDVDLGYRAIKRGYKNIWVKDCVVTLPEEKGVIEENISKGKLSKIAQRNQLLFIWKNITSENLITEHKSALIKMLLTKPGYWPVFISAVIKYPEILGKRTIEKKEQKLSDEEILEMFKK